MTLLREAAAVAGKDLRIEVRGRYALGAVLPFSATLLIVFGLSLGPGRTLLQQVAPGLLWLAVPVLLGGVRATDLAAAGRGGEALSWLGLLVAFDAVFLAAGTLVFGYLLED